MFLQLFSEDRLDTGSRGHRVQSEFVGDELRLCPHDGFVDSWDTLLAKEMAAGEPDTWEAVFRRLYPVAHAVAESRLRTVASNESEEVAMETMQEILASQPSFKTWDDLKALTGAIAHNKAIDRLRKHLSQKRGGKKVISLDALPESERSALHDASHEAMAQDITTQELRELLGGLLKEIKKKHRIVLREHFFNGLSYREIAEKHGLTISAVGVYLQRGVHEMRKSLARVPSMKRELLDVLGDAGAVRLILPLISAIELAGWIFSDRARFQTESMFSPDRLSAFNEPSDDERLENAQESLPEAKDLRSDQQTFLSGLLCRKFPDQFAAREQKQEAGRQRETARLLDQQDAKRKGMTIFWMCLLLVALAFALFGCD